MRISDWSSDVCSSDLVDPKAFADRPGRRGACGAAIIEHQAFEDDLEGIGAALGAPLREDAIADLAIPKLDRLIFVATHTFAPDRLATAVNAPLQLGPDKALLARAPLPHGDGNRWLHMASLPDHRQAELWAQGKAGATVPPDSARVEIGRANV